MNMSPLLHGRGGGHTLRRRARGKRRTAQDSDTTRTDEDETNARIHAHAHAHTTPLTINHTENGETPCKGSEFQEGGRREGRTRVTAARRSGASIRAVGEEGRRRAVTTSHAHGLQQRRRAFAFDTQKNGRANRSCTAHSCARAEGGTLISWRTGRGWPPAAWAGPFATPYRTRRLPCRSEPLPLPVQHRRRRRRAAEAAAVRMYLLRVRVWGLPRGCCLACGM
jgi:hypothetical protein